VSVSAQLESAVVAPEGAPRILDDPVLVASRLSLALAVADDRDGMVHILVVRVAAVAIPVHDDTLPVVRQAVEIRVDGCTDRSLSDELAHTIVRDQVFFKRSCVIKTFLGVAAWVAAARFAAKVACRIVVPANDTVLAGPVPGVRHPATVAPFIDIVAVHQVLHRVHRRNFEVVFDCVQTLEDSCGREGPAGTTATLVDRLTDLTSFVPVDIVRQGTRLCLFFICVELSQLPGLCGGFAQLGAEVERFKFVGGHISELVDDLGPRDLTLVVPLVVLFNVAIIGAERLKLGHMLSFGGVGSAILCNELRES